jgi:hypothetical protein
MDGEYVRQTEKEKRKIKVRPMTTARTSSHCCLLLKE